jgi:cysteinyl-tRNA synthetase
MNITDLDDKTILGSEREGEEISRFTEKHIRGFKKDCETIGIKPADQYPRASQHVEDMARVAKKLDTCVDTLLRLTDGAPYHELDQLVYGPGGKKTRSKRICL